MRIFDSLKYGDETKRETMRDQTKNKLANKKDSKTMITNFNLDLPVKIVSLNKTNSLIENET